MSGGVKKVRVLYRSRPVQYPMLAAMKAANAWERAGLDPGDEVPYVKGTNSGDQMLVDGQVDVIFGSHVTPYLRFDEGVPFVYLGQTVNYVDDSVATREPITSLEDLRGKRLADDTDDEYHPFGNHLLYLSRAGIGEHDVEWLDTPDDRLLDAIEAGRADGAFLMPPDDEEARARGLHVYTPPLLPMVYAATITTLWPNVAADPDLYARIITAVRLGIAFFQDEPEAMRKVMREDVAVALGIDSEERLDKLYARNCGLLDRSLYPTADAVHNAFLLAVRQRADLGQRLSPMALWDVHLLRELDAS